MLRNINTSVLLTYKLRPTIHSLINKPAVKRKFNCNNMLSFLRSMLLVLVLLFSLSQAFPVKTYMRVYNVLGPGSILNVHCKSKDDNLGLHILHFQEFFSWHFRPNFFGTTLFFCRLHWQGKKAGTFDIFKYSYGDLCGPKCYWFVKPAGPCLQGNLPGKEFCLPWLEG